MKTLVSLVVLVAIVSVGGVYYVGHLGAEPSVAFRTVPVVRQELVATISATGTLEPEEVVDVGAQVAGRIESLGIDVGRSASTEKKTIDYGSVVQEGTVLARIDAALYGAQVEQAKATLRRAEADLGQMKAKLDQAVQDLRRAETLRPKKAIADSDYDLAVANHKTALANLGVGEATIGQTKAALNLAETNLSYTVIKSPVKGLIIDRRVNIGQTVVASLNAPSLFLIAKDLSRMQVWAAVNEADIGRIKAGLPVRFTVDAYPKEAFRGKVIQIRLNATMTQNVVTYTVVVETDNSDLRLIPYLTANLQFETDRLDNVLVVPNAGLRWKPRSELIVPELRESVRATSSRRAGKENAGSSGEKETRVKKEAPSTASESKQAPQAKDRDAEKVARAQQRAGQLKDREERGRIWVKVGAFVRPVEVRIGNTDGSNTVVSGDEVKENMEVVIGEVVPEASASGTTNPFAPTFFKGSKRS